MILTGGEIGTFLSVLLLLPIYSLFIDWQGLQPFLLKYLFPVYFRFIKLFHPQVRPRLA